MTLVNKYFIGPESAIGLALRIFDAKVRRKVAMMILFQSFLGFLDLVGIALIGVVGALGVTGVESQKPGNTIYKILKFVGINNFGFQSQIVILSISAAFFLVLKTAVSVLVNRKSLFFLAECSTSLSSNVTKRVFQTDLQFLKKYSHQEILFATCDGIERISIGILGSLISLVADSVSLVVMFLALIIFNPTLGFAILVFFGLVAVILQRVTSKIGQRVGAKNSKLRLKSNVQYLETLATYKEMWVKNRLPFLTESIFSIRNDLGKSTAEQYFLPNVSKYVIETSLILGGLLVSGIQFFLQDARHAVGSLAIILAAGARVAPALLRVQQGLLVIKVNSGATEISVNFIRDLEKFEELKEHQIVISSFDENSQSNLEKFNPSVVIEKLAFKYNGDIHDTLSEVSLEFSQGTLNAIVGPSGAGKSTLVDLILGLCDPTNGKVQISGLSPKDCISRFPGKIAYVPQDIELISGTIRDNLTFGFDREKWNDNYLWNLLRIVNLESVVERLPNHLDQEIGERGALLSGGQRQRLGIARALNTEPELLILDEATSSLDGESEDLITKALIQLKGSVTIILIAHRLATVRAVDKLVYLSDGNKIAEGRFDEVRLKVPDFDKQANLLGL